MASDSRIQAGAAVVQAAANTASLVPSLGSLTITTLTAPTKLTKSHSYMEKKMDKLHKIECRLKDQLWLYWFPEKKWVHRWLREVERTDLEVKKLKDQFSKLEHTSGINPIPHLTLTDKIDDKCKDIDDVINDGKELEHRVKKESTRIIKLDTTPSSIANVLSLKQKMDQLLEYVKDETFNTIRVQGAPGRGKTVLIQHLNNLEEGHKIFDIVIWIPVSDIENHDKGNSIEVGIRRAIANRLGICIEGIKYENDLASKISAELDGAKYLLLLDAVKVNIKLETIGIPMNTKGSKIVYTTSLGVYPFGIPQHHQSFTLTMEKKLSDADSWQIFHDILIKENALFLQPRVKPLARLVAKSCDGCFSLIKIVAEDFKSRITETSWSEGWKMLQTSAMKEDLCMKVHKKTLNFSYGSLKENEKKCFLFCVLYPEDHKIPVNCLFDCWAANNLLQTGVTAEDILYHLSKMALLDESLNKQYVTIDKELRGATMKILQEHDQLKFLVAPEANAKLQNNDCKDIHWISLANSGIDVLPTEVDCPKLTTLFLQKNSKMKTISSSFFKKNNKLLVLDLYKTGLESMPPMSHLQMLKVLYVNGCAKLKEIPFKIEGPDHMLEVLDIRGCAINKIAHDFQNLKHLRRLMVSIDRGINSRILGDLKISELSSLNELIIDVKSDVVPTDGKIYMSWCNEVIEDIIEKIDPSEELTALKFHFEYGIVDVIQVSCDTLRIFVPKQGILKHIWKEKRNHQCSNAQVYIGSRMTSTSEIPKFLETTSFVLSCDKIVSEPVIEEVLIKAKALIMIKDNSTEHLDQTGISTSCNIHDCLVHRCNKIETLLQTNGLLYLNTLILSECSQLKVVFSNNVVQQVSIKHLEIRECSAIKEINILSTAGCDILPTLETLVLHNLRKLKKILSDKKWPSLTTLEIHKCPKLKELPLNGDSADNLRIIKVEKMWWESLQLGHEIGKKFNQYCEFSD